MVRPCVARGFPRSVGSSVLHQCIRPLIGACAPGHHGYQRACVLISGQASSGPFGSPVFACVGKTGPPSLLILSQTSAGNGICYFIITCSLSVQFLCSCQEAVPSSRPAVDLRRRAQGPSSLAVALTSPLARRFQAKLDGTEHGATLKQVGAPFRPVRPLPGANRPARGFAPLRPRGGWRCCSIVPRQASDRRVTCIARM